MASRGVDFRCKICDSKICAESYPCTIRNRHAYVSGISDCVQKTNQGKKCVLVCSCGEYVGEFIACRKGLQYCLNLEKVRRCSVGSSEHIDAEGVCPHQMTVALQTESGASTLSSKCGEEAGKEDEIMQLKQTVAALEQTVQSMEEQNVKKFTDMCGMFLKQKLEIQRLQEIIWALHPKVDLNPAFIVNTKASYFVSAPAGSFCDLDVDED